MQLFTDFPKYEKEPSKKSSQLAALLNVWRINGNQSYFGFNKAYRHDTFFNQSK